MIKETLNQYVTTQDKLWSHDRTKSVGSSEIGQCARKVWYSKHDQAPDDDYKDSWGARMRGTVMENVFYAPAMRARFGKNFLFGGDEQKTLIAGPLSATPDGIVIGLKKDALKHLGVRSIDNECLAVECKTADPRTNLSEAKPQNLYQTHVQMGLIREQTKYKPHYALLSYIDASFWDQVIEFAVPFSAKIYEAAKVRAKNIIEAKAATDFAPEGWIGGGAECKFCPFLKSCNIVRRNLPYEDAPVDPQFKAEMEDMVTELARLEDHLDVQTVAVREQQQAIKDRLREKGVKKIPGVVQWSWVSGRSGYDNKAIQAAAVAAGVDIEEFKTKGEPTDRLAFK